MLEVYMLDKQSRLLRHLIAVLVAIAGILALEVGEPRAASANPPRNPLPTIPKAMTPKQSTNWLGINWNRIITKLIPKPHMPKLPANMKTPKVAANPKAIPKLPAPPQQVHARATQPATVVIPTPKQSAPAQRKLPQMIRARNDLTEAWQYISAAAQLPAKKKTAVLTSISQALITLGGATPKPIAPGKKGDLIQLAEEHLVKAHKEVLEYKTLPLAEKTAALADIRSAMIALKVPANPGGGKAAAGR